MHKSRSRAVAGRAPEEDGEGRSDAHEREDLVGVVPAVVAKSEEGALVDARQHVAADRAEAGEQARALFANGRRRIFRDQVEGAGNDLDAAAAAVVVEVREDAVLARLVHAKAEYGQGPAQPGIRAFRFRGHVFL
jgi:hypothetical protein